MPDTTSDQVIDDLNEYAESNPEFQQTLVASIQAASEAAAQNLYGPLYDALDWPATYGDYIEFLRAFARLVPTESSDAAWVDPHAPKIEGLEEHQEVYDRLCHFYWLIDQPVGPNGEPVQNDDFFSKWLIEYADVWGDFLDTTESFDQATLDSFLDNAPKYRVQDSMIGDPPRPNNPSGWLTFNQFFARELNPGLRPIEAPTDNKTVTVPADCTYRNHFSINDDGSIPDVTFKGTGSYATVQELLQGGPYADSFGGGSFVHLFLGPYSYHRFHTPVDGSVVDRRAVEGFTYLKVQIAGGKPGTPGDQFQAYDSATSGYEFNQARGVLVIDTANSPCGNVGLVAVVPVGMCQVSGVNMTHEIDTDCRKGDEFGYFTFRGSDIAILFQAGADPQYNAAFTAPDGPPYSLYGTLLANVSAR